MNTYVPAVLSLSGGMDSTSLLLHLLAHGHPVTALSFDYGQKHRVELERAQELTTWLKTRTDIRGLTHHVIRLDGLGPLLTSSSLVTGGRDVPEGHYEQETMKDTVVPNRNKIFSSIIQSVALSQASVLHTPALIAMGIHAGDHAIYPDCREEFRDADFHAFRVGNWHSELVSYYTPYLELTKYDILKDAVNSCQQLRLEFNEVFKRTNTSYHPLLLDGVWYSDYKTAASVERIEAFIRLGVPDPVAYADDTGPVTWAIAKHHVEQVLETHESRHHH